MRKLYCTCTVVCVWSGHGGLADQHARVTRYIHRLVISALYRRRQPTPGVECRIEGIAAATHCPRRPHLVGSRSHQPAGRRTMSRSLAPPANEYSWVTDTSPRSPAYESYHKDSNVRASGIGPRSTVDAMEFSHNRTRWRFGKVSGVFDRCAAFGRSAVRIMSSDESNRRRFVDNLALPR